MEHDFSGYATRNDLVCSDGRTIKADAFKHQDGAKVPLVWNHRQNEPGNVLGHAMLQNRADGVYATAFLNGNEQALETRELLRHGDVDSLSIHANQLRQRGDDVLHGNIREVSIVLAGANPGAYIDNINISHSDDGDTESGEAIIFSGIKLSHAEESTEGDASVADTDTDTEVNDESVQDVIDSMSEKQKNAMYFVVASAADEDKESSDSDSDSSEDTDSAEHGDNSESLEHSQEGDSVSHSNIFEGTDTKVGDSLSHAQYQAIFNDAQKCGSLQEAVLMHAGTYGIDNIEVLFPEARAITNTPEFIKRETEWVAKVLAGTSKLPFARIKSLHADITHDEARAKGYIKGSLKKEEFFGLTQRKTGPATIYKKQKLDRDDIIDATTMDVVNWLWAEMRLMLNEEIARAILFGDGRAVDHEDKVKEPTNTLADGDGIRSIANDHEFYTYQVVIPSGQNTANMIKSIQRQRKNYKGTGNPAFYTTEDVLTDMLLLEDKLGRALYATQAELEAKLRVKEIIPVEAMESVEGLLGVMVNLADYSVGTDKGGQITSFDQFDIDYNQYKYLLEGRMSGALTRYRTAVAIWRGAGTSVTPNAPTFNAATNTITVVAQTGVTYTLDGADLPAGDTVITEDAWVQANPDAEYYFPANSTTEWSFTFTAA